MKRTALLFFLSCNTNVMPRLRCSARLALLVFYTTTAPIFLHWLIRRLSARLEIRHAEKQSRKEGLKSDPDPTRASSFPPRCSYRILNPLLLGMKFHPATVSQSGSVILSAQCLVKCASVTKEERARVNTRARYSTCQRRGMTKDMTGT